MLKQILSRIEEREEETLLTVKNIRVFAVFICVIGVLVSLFFGAAKEVALGVFLGGAAAQLIFRQHEIAIGKSLFSGSEKNASIITIINFVLRLVIRIAVLFVAIKNPEVSFIGAALGLLSISYSICVTAFLDNLVRKQTGKEV
ncbi:MAG: ATP synthase subunit I [Oscillospiraceae bacterium]|nr:ATP synthase subunit I [Oscillospiraceae bacterium]